MSKGDNPGEEERRKGKGREGGRENYSVDEMPNQEEKGKKKKKGSRIIIIKGAR